jgi:hypothetical protein
MDLRRRSLGILTILLCCAACSASALRSTMPAPPTVAEARLAAEKGPFLYVAGYKVSQYALGSSEPLRTVKGPFYFAISMALDPLGNLSVLFGNGSGGEILVYQAGDLKREYSPIYPPGFGEIAVDSKGNIYHAYGGPGIPVYPPGYREPLYTIHRNARAPYALAFDPSGDLYSDGVDRVNAYSPTGPDGRMKWVRSFRNGVEDSYALAFGATGDLFVADGRAGRRKPAEINVYAPGASKPSRTITAGIEAPGKLAVDSNDRLYVACMPIGKIGNPGWISVYAPGSTQPIRKIREGINHPYDLAIDPSDNLYVANAGAGSVTVYSPGGAKLMRTITKGIDGAAALVIGSVPAR